MHNFNVATAREPLSELDVLTDPQELEVPMKAVLLSISIAVGLLAIAAAYVLPTVESSERTYNMALTE
jgi:hypothetical protein